MLLILKNQVGWTQSILPTTLWTHFTCCAWSCHAQRSRHQALLPAHGLQCGLFFEQLPVPKWKRGTRVAFVTRIQKDGRSQGTCSSKKLSTKPAKLVVVFLFPFINKLVLQMTPTRLTSWAIQTLGFLNMFASRHESANSNSAMVGRLTATRRHPMSAERRLTRLTDWTVSADIWSDQVGS